MFYWMATKSFDWRRPQTVQIPCRYSREVRVATPGYVAVGTTSGPVVGTRLA